MSHSPTRHFHTETIKPLNIKVVKIGGKVIEDPTMLASFLQTFACLTSPKILVHGGGRNATHLANRLGLEATLIEGRRVTDAAMLEVVVMVYGGWVNKQIVSQLQAYQCDALGLTGADMNCVQATLRPAQPIDFGLVGDVRQVRTEPLLNLLQQGVVPVLAPVTHDGRGQLLNTNADTIAGRVAEALAPTASVDLYYLFEKAGVLADPADDTSLIPQLSEIQYRQHRADGSIVEGMIPKLDNAFRTLRAGVKNVYIAHHQAVSQLDTDAIGTQLCLSPNLPPTN